MLPISVEDARKILGPEAEHWSDEYIEKLILDLDFIARCALRDAARFRAEGATPDKGCKKE